MGDGTSSKARFSALVVVGALAVVGFVEGFKMLMRWIGWLP